LRWVFLLFEGCRDRLELPGRGRQRECPVDIQAGHGSQEAAEGLQDRRTCAARTLKSAQQLQKE